MKRRSTSPALVVGLLMAASTLPLAAEEDPRVTGPVATDHLNGTVLAVAPLIDYRTAVLRVSGPNGYALAKVFETGESISADLLTEADAASVIGPGEVIAPLAADMADGRYRYEVVLHVGEGQDPVVHAGRFMVLGGSTRSADDVRADLSRTRRDLNAAVAERELFQPPSGEGDIVDDFIHIADIAVDSLTEITLTSYNAPYSIEERWSLVNAFGNFSIQECGTQYGGNCQATRMFFEQDVGGEVGINTSTPLGRLHVVGSGNQLILDDNAGSRHAFQQTASSLTIRNELAQSQVQIFDSAPSSSLVLGASGVGVGTSSPVDKLHVSNAGTQLRLEDTTSGAFHRFSQTSAGLSIFDNNSTTVFISSVAPSNSLVIQLSGIGIGTTTPEAKLHVNGSGIIEGDFSVGSSRTIKHQIESLDTAAVLKSVRKLPLYAWKYRDDPNQAAHIGPMAEDVFGAFQLGRDDKHLSPADTAGLALAGVQGVDKELKLLLQRIAALQEQVQALSHDAGLSPQTCRARTDR